MAKKPELEDIDLDGLPSHDELDALQAQIDQAAADTKKRAHAKASDEKSDKGHDGTGEIESELSELDVANARVETLETELATLKDQALRALADAENTKKRAEREVKAASAYGI
ncbi:MAG: hypothetical protein HKO02_00850, partial [Hyphomonadaceae bacterium]|nr:hypothetical protein [Hyphomonadaceae bacterium]